MATVFEGKRKSERATQRDRERETENNRPNRRARRKLRGRKYLPEMWTARADLFFCGGREILVSHGKSGMKRIPGVLGEAGAFPAGGRWAPEFSGSFSVRYIIMALMFGPEMDGRGRLRGATIGERCNHDESYFSRVKGVAGGQETLFIHESNQGWEK
jgi:hypothetical protein